eukprot:2952837-Prymnesium_polylepis.1
MDDDIVVARAVGGVTLVGRLQFQVDGESFVPDLVPKKVIHRQITVFEIVEICTTFPERLVHGDDYPERARVHRRPLRLTSTFLLLSDLTAQDGFE